VNLALFDFDGTITHKDSLIDFIKFAVGKPRYYVGMLRLSPMLVMFKLKIMSGDIAKQQFIAHFFTGYDEHVFKSLGEQYALSRIDNIVRAGAMEKINWHLQRGDKVVVVSASIVSWLKAWCDQNNIDLLSTELAFEGGKVTGQFATKNCIREEKVRRIKHAYALTDFNKLYAYGDSAGDKAMLALANKSYFKPFR
jgi:HAD superfamily hydrolase (TIGR01490 family)